MPLPEPLRVLVALATPKGLPPLDLERERRILLESLGKNRAKIQVDFVAPATPSVIRAALEEKPYHVFHFSGHGFASRDSPASLILEGEDGSAHRLDAESLAQLLRGSASLRLVFLSACDTSTPTEADVFSSMAAFLVLQGVPAVVANQSPISDSGSIAFTKLFYRFLAEGRSLDEGVTAGRLAVRLAAANTYEWGVPSLFSRLPAHELVSRTTRAVFRENEVVRSAALDAVLSASEQSTRESRVRQQGGLTERGVAIPAGAAGARVVPYADAFAPIKESTDFLLRELEAAHRQARMRADSWSRASLVGASFGLALVSITVLMLFLGNVDAGKISAISSVVTGAIAALFFAQSKHANNRLDASMRELTLARDVNLAFQIAATISNEVERNALSVTIVRRVLDNADRGRWTSDAPKLSAPSERTQES
jgi:hypothetical protein